MENGALRVLVVDDQPAVVEALEVLLQLNEIAFVSTTDPDRALEIARSECLGAVIQDMNFSANETSGGEGAELFRALRNADPELPVLLITAWASLELAVELVREGAADYVQKPWDDDKLVATIRNLVNLRRLAIENRHLKERTRRSRDKLAEDHDLCGVVYESEAMHEVLSLAVSVARSDAAVLITGPSGAGKERVAEIVRVNSRRRDRAFVRVNVGAIPEDLAESELFGAEPGAYTGITRRRIGHFESADGGTIFLDEVDALSLAGQVKLLRAVQSGEFRRLGSSRELKADVRLISATNSDLETAIAEGRFREDLFYRLNVVELRIPGLADRRDDILPLARHFLSLHEGDRPDRGRRLGTEACRALVEHSWPGNVRELENRIQRAVVVGREGPVSALDLGLEESRNPAPAIGLDPDSIADREAVLAALEASRGVVAHAAERLGISRQALYRRMERLGIEIERRARPDPADLR